MKSWFFSVSLIALALSTCGARSQPPATRSGSPAFLRASGSVCPDCRGSGVKICAYCKGEDLTKHTCTYCDGEDLTRRTCAYCKGEDLTKRTCSYCNGEDLTKRPCAYCKGSGGQCWSCRGSGRLASCWSCRGRGKQAACWSCRGRGKQAACWSCRGRGKQSSCWSCRGQAARGGTCSACNGDGHIERIVGYDPPDLTLLPPATGTPYPTAEDGSYFGEIGALTGEPKTIYVKGYYRKDGTYVRSHYRSRSTGSISVRGPPLVFDSFEFSPFVAENGSYYGEISDYTGRPKTVHVRGYYRKDGTYVRGHYRSKPRR